MVCCFAIPIRKTLRLIDSKFVVTEVESYSQVPVKEQINIKLITKRQEFEELSQKLYETELHINQLEELLKEV